MKKHKKLYFVAVGGAAYVISQSIKKSEVIAYPELGMEAVHKMVIEDMPVTVAIDCMGNCIHNEGPKEWKKLNIVKSKLKN
jgi:fumarate hydratase class I